MFQMSCVHTNILISQKRFLPKLTTYHALKLKLETLVLKFNVFGKNKSGVRKRDEKQQEKHTPIYIYSLYSHDAKRRLNFD